MSKDKEISANDFEPTEHLSDKHHMAIPWHDFFTNDNFTPAYEANLVERAAIVGRIGLMMLSYGTGAWRVRDSMNTVARTLKMTCSVDIGLVSLEYTCMDAHHSYTQAISLPSTSVNTTKLSQMERFIKEFDQNGSEMTIGEIHSQLEEIAHSKGNYAPYQVGLAAALACSAFVFLLGGGPVEMFCSFIGAGLGNYVRRKMIDHHITLFAGVAVAVAVACLSYLLALSLMQLTFNVSSRHEAGYIGAMLFIIPGFPFITSGLDISKLDMRSGLERMTYAIAIITVATLVGWIVALMVNLRPENFQALPLSALMLFLLRLPASFCGVFGFSIMFNSTPKMAAIAGCIGAIANTLRLELTDLTGIPAGAAAFLGALVAGLLASIVKRKIQYPQISITVPSIVIMVPGLYMYRAMYNIGLTSISVGTLWMTKALMIVVFLPMGLIAARILTDSKWRHNG
ncbi:threonine/serine exporter family protein [Limosilactobacillus reuteri]|uniref:threonine/serine ThrE exporter family protein n=1 Tax=Limosilactobacillus reuteri TaxID=1598 RepID=UPI001E493F1F|nr:threonine/serine exporter family protein [Limosilactobacillus reuteri]MCC4435992.1 threonine/serine exporter family protein [Limosilactobacillus reuteri]MCC4438481.1 threonine/serine exporter family protein [Limosilactobacillus reuteri]MCC4442188.1 threonine/serine exporter family protein [Limosilactobacillus reuteri]MCC4444380.1 threonine/serine exporter family protein [Limosilactobacillus reuteri]MCC4446066.1 threonine/serine exporter family protein [Limosilactobacillus reuteri]